jgi:hypothetical protein
MVKINANKKQQLPTANEIQNCPACVFDKHHYLQGYELCKCHYQSAH